MRSFLCIVCSSTRKALNLQDKAGEADSCDCCLITAGSCPKGGKHYAVDEQITLEALQSEIQAPNEVNIYKIPGVSRFLPFWRDCIACAGLHLWYALQGAQLNMECGSNGGSRARAGCNTVNHQIRVDDEVLVATVGGEPIDEDRIYNVGSIREICRASDVATFGAYFDAHPEAILDHDAGVPPHTLLLQYWATKVWEDIFHNLDTSNDNCITMNELAVLDIDGDGCLCKSELMDAARRAHKAFSLCRRKHMHF